MLENYEEVPRDEWDQIPKNTHIRYLRKDGAFRRGGFIKANYTSSYGEDKGKQSIQLASNLSYKSSKWTVSFDDLEKIWKKNNSGVPSNNSIPNSQITELANNVKNNKETIEQLNKLISQMRIDITRLTNDNTRTLNLIKKLHNIKMSRP